MPNTLDIDHKSLLLPFDPAQVDRSGLRLRPSEFARLMDTSKQAVSQWIKSGKITLGVDGRLDPRAAVRQLLRNSDPARLRAKILEPLVRDLGAYHQRIDELEKSLVAAKEDAELHEGIGDELEARWLALRRHLAADWCDLRLLPAPVALAALSDWCQGVEESDIDGETTSIMDCADLPVPVRGGDAREIMAPAVEGGAGDCHG